MKFFGTHRHSRSLMILVILVVAVGLGFLFDFIVTQIEKTIYPRGYEDYVTVYAEAYDVPAHLVYAVMKCESDFDSGAVSHVGAIGLMQLTPDTFDWLTNEVLYEHLDPGMMYDPETNVRYGTYYLSRLFRQFGSWDLVLIAYNAGPTRVSQWLEDPAYADGNGGLSEIPFSETRGYVKKVQRVMDTYDRLYGTELQTADTTETQEN